MSAFAPLPDPPYYAVIFATQASGTDAAGYGRMAETIEDLATRQPGYLGIESTRGADGFGITVSYWAEVPDNITLLKLPPYSPELNPMENVWAYLRANKLAISVFDNYEQIVDRCCEAWNFFANDKTAITSITTRQWAKTVND